MYKELFSGNNSSELLNKNTFFKNLNGFES